MSLIIKNATLEDSDIISNIYALSWKNAYKGIVPQKYLDELKLDFWTEHFQTWISEDSLKAGILYVENMPVGCVTFGNSRDEKLPDWGEIPSIYIHPDFYHKGYGEKLLTYALNQLRIAGYINCYLWVLSENTNAIKFYENNEFLFNGDTCVCNIMGNDLTDLRYVCSL